MAKLLLRTAVVAATAAMAMTGATGVAGAVSPNLYPELGYYGITFTPEETKFIASTPVPGLLGFLPSQAVSVYGYPDAIDNAYPWSPASSQRIFDSTVRHNESIDVALLNPILWDGSIVSIAQLD